MILITAHLCPKGDKTKARLLGRIEIANDGTGTEDLGNYTAELHAEYTPAKGPGRTATLRGFNRKKQSVWSLVGGFLKCWRHTNITKRQTEETTEPDWCPVEDRQPAIMDSVIVWGTLEGEAEPDSHEGFLSYGPATAPRWRSVRAEEDGGLNRRILDVTHWMPRPRGPTIRMCNRGSENRP